MFITILYNYYELYIHTRPLHCNLYILIIIYKQYSCVKRSVNSLWVLIKNQCLLHFTGNDELLPPLLPQLAPHKVSLYLVLITRV